MLEGFVTAGTLAAGILLVGTVIVAVLMNTPRPEHQDVTGDAASEGGAEDAESVLAHHRSLGQRVHCGSGQPRGRRRPWPGRVVNLLRR
ncbi:hypothetical protein [Streptomyces sp. NPDC052015]|uniref:hypothetical protein n=1 Tax=Streptomyces sp. NPDC052015 TaxID=3154755 RepID=UPI003421EDDE